MPNGVYRRNMRHLQLTSDVYSPDVSIPLNRDPSSLELDTPKVQYYDLQEATKPPPSVPEHTKPHQTRSRRCVDKPKQLSTIL